MTCLYGTISDSNRLLIKVGIRKLNFNGFIFYNAMIDTGATHSCISHNIINNLKLELFRKHKIYNMRDNIETDSYIVDLLIVAQQQTLFAADSLEIIKFNAKEDFEIIIGMDLLTKSAVLSVTGDRKFILCF